MENKNETAQANLSNHYNNYMYQQYDSAKEVIKKEQNEYNDFVQKLQQFETISTVSEAKELAATFLTLHENINQITIGNATCIIVNEEEHFRISLDSPKEFISYEFV